MKFKRALCLTAFALAASVASAQQSVSIVTEPDQQVLNYTGSLLTSACYAKSTLTIGPRASTYVAISGISKAAAAVVTSTGHGFAVSSRPQVTISGATGTGWTGVNATWTATILGADTFSIPIDSQAFGTLAGTIVFVTTAPRSTMYEWKVQKLVYDTSNLLIWTGWLGGSPAYTWRCSDASSTTLKQQ